VDVTVFGIDGKLAKSIQHTSTSRPVYIGDLPPGPYIVRMVSTDGVRSGIGRFVKR
jgi:hypothetical protein